MVAVGSVVCWERVHRCVVTDAGGRGEETEVCAAWSSSAWCVSVCVRACVCAGRCVCS